MFWKRMAIPAALVLAVTTFAYAKNELLGVDESDLGYERSFVPAKRLEAPEPGHAYAFDIASREFRATSLCEQTGLNIVERAPPKVFRVINEAGVSYNTALEALADKIPFLSTDFLREDQAEVTYRMTARVNTAHEAKFHEACWKKVEDRLNDGKALVFIVDVVYLDTNSERQHHLVRFDPTPLTPKPCVGECEKLATTLGVARPEWTAVVKERFVVVK